MKSTVCALLSVTLTLMVVTNVVFAQVQSPSVPVVIPVEGQLTTETGQLRSGTVVLKIAIYADDHDPNPLWVENQIVTLDGSGRYSVYAGQTQDAGLPQDLFAGSQARWLGVTVDLEQERPRVMLLSVPYASKAAVADSLGGKTATDFVLTEKFTESVREALRSTNAEASSPARAAGEVGVLGTTSCLARFDGSGNPTADSQICDDGQKIKFGGSFDARDYIRIGATYTPSSGTSAYGMSFVPTINPGVGGDSAGFLVQPTLQRAGSHGTFGSMILYPPTITGSGSLTNAASLLIVNSPTVATNNYSLWVDSGTSRFDGNVDVDGTLKVTNTGPHAIGGTTDPRDMLRITGSYTPTTGTSAYGMSFVPTLNPRAGGDSAGFLVQPTLQRVGAHDTFGSMILYPPTITGGGALTNAASLVIVSSPTAGTNNYALWIDNGVSRFDGNVGIGTSNPTSKLDVVGDATFSGTVSGGNIIAKYQDVAEWVDSAEPLPAGSVVIIDQAAHNRVKASSTAYDSRVAGAVSPQPGLILGESGEGRVLVAQSGRVRIKADAAYGAIKAGDLLVTSPRKGYAMKSKPVRIGEATVHRPGTVLGKALEPLSRGQGEILVLLTLQ